MSLPVSQYEALLAEMRGLRRKAQRVQQIARPLLHDHHSSYSLDGAAGLREFRPRTEQFYNDGSSEPLDYTMESLLLGRHNATSPNYDHGVASSVEGDTTCSEDEYGGATRSSTKLSVSSEPPPDTNRVGALYHGTWPVERTMWNSEPASLGAKADSQTARKNIGNQMEVTSVMSFASSSGGVPLDRVLGSPDKHKWSSQQLEAKMDVVHSLLSMLGGQEHVDMGETLLALSSCPESCLAMRQSGCIPLLVQLVQSDRDGDTRTKAAQALHNLVHSQPDEKLRKRESRVLKLLEHCRAYTEALKNNVDFQQLPNTSVSEDGDKHPVQTVAHLMKLSFDEGHRQAICQLGGIHTIATLVEVEHTMHSSTSTESHCILMRRYACMALTNLTFGDSGNKALLCSFKEFMGSLVVQLQSPSDELRQVTASVLRNLSWRADSTSKEILREVGSVTGLMKAAMLDNKENTLKSILSALWNLSAHCTENKSEICGVDGALGFLVDLLTYKTPTKSLAIIENSGGILRNISSQIAVREDYREILRRHNCLQILLDQLKSPSLTIVSNACGTLWNLSAKCQTDQEALWQMGAPSMLRCLNHSKHKMIAMGSSAALKNLLSAKPQQMFQQDLDATALTLDLPTLPTLGARKQKAIMQDLDPSLSETYENIEKDSPIKKEPRRKSEIQDLSNNFSSLNLNEPSTSYSTDPRLTPRMPQTYGSTSLPYKRPNCTYIPVRNKFSDCAYDDEISDQPIDYSKKYSETKIPNVETASTSTRKESDYSYSKQQTEKENFGIYAETDLDQPTDYSLRYAEDDSDSEIAKNEDTVKTYCTEDTPYETPFNFSTATSMTDLRMDDKQVIDNDKLKDRETKSSKKINESPEEKERCSTEDISDLDHRTKLTEKIPKSELSSGLMSPEKPVNYAEEGTPGYFSRVSSFGSLTSIPANEPMKETKENGTSSLENERKNSEKTSPKAPVETKAVKFERVVNYAEETPLMFSRSSSLASLDSIEQHSIHDDRSSVVSDFSRLTSGIVSPSELPDSPTQTVPPSPKPRKISQEFPTSSKVARGASEGRPQPPTRTPAKPSVFEDNLTKFKEESTPIQFSTATSLSSLTIDDHEDTAEQASGRKPEEPIDEEEKIENEEVEKKDEEKETTVSDINDEFVVESDVDEDILADCISIGMQNNRHNQSKAITTSTPTKLPVSSFKYAPKVSQNNSGIPMPRSNVRTTTSHSNPVRLSGFVNEINITGNQADTIRTYYTEDTPVRLSNAASNSDLSLLSVSNGKEGSRKGDYLSDDSSNLSGENDNILAECIQSGMPKAKRDTKIPANNKPSSIPSSLPRRNIPSGTSAKFSGPPPPSLATGNARRGGEAPKVSSSSSSSDQNRRDNSLPVYLNTARDEVENYAVENSPCPYSLRSSLSDLTVDGSVAALKRNGVHNQTEGPSSHKPEPTVNQESHSTNSDKSQDHNAQQQSRRESLSSISVESLGSLEAEQALLAQCISSGMPKSHSETRSKPLDIPKSRVNHVEPQSHSYDSSSPTRSDPHPKNASAASVAGNIEPPPIHRQFINSEPHYPANQSNAVAGVERNPEIPEESGIKEAGVAAAVVVVGAATSREENDRHREAPEKTGIPTRNNHTDISLDKCSPTEEISSPGVAKSGSRDSLHKILDVMEDRLIRSCEDTKAVDNRMLDPDAMIESLDRFTAELVSQASHLNKDENYKVSTGDNTWNEEISPNDVTFPSISGSAPNVITFSNEDEPVEDLINDVPEEGNQPSNDFSSINTSTMTDSTLIAIEASRMATAFKKEADMSASITSAASLELDHVQPPSHLNSLTNSAVGLPRSPKLPKRKKSLPAGLMVRRALNNSLNNGSSLESLSNLDHVNPPSDLLYDMEGSMTSVASLPSDHRTDFLINGPINHLRSTQHPIFDLKQPFSELENINPPSLFNEITDFCNSLADVPTEAIGSETEIFEDCFTHVVDEDGTAADVTIAEDVADGLSESVMETALDDEDDITLFSDARSSIESTPKKIRNLSKSMTSKQRRNQARDRYKTYTVAAEMVMREEIEKQRESSENLCLTTTENFKTISEDYRTAVGGDSGVVDPDSTTDSHADSPTYNVGKEKLTPKERRQMNRSRFETQILDKATTDILRQPVINSPPTPEASLSNSNSCSSSPAQSPARTKLSIRRNFMQKRLENRERFRTRTISESSFSPEISSSSSPPLNGEAEVQLHLQKEANRVLKTLRDTKAQEELLDCETLSLVSNDDDSEYNSGGSVNYRTYHKSWGMKKNVPVITNANNAAHHPPDSSPVEEEVCTEDEDHDEPKVPCKPKIVKPTEKPNVEEVVVDEEQPKGIRGRRKPLYSKTVTSSTPKSIKPVRNVTSNLIKNVTSSLKSGTALKTVVGKQNKNATPQTQSRTSSGYGSRSVSNSLSPKTSPARTPASIRSSPKHVAAATRTAVASLKSTPPLDRQGTFTKDEPSPSSTTTATTTTTTTTTPQAISKPVSKIPTVSKIPSFASKIASKITPMASASKIPGKPPISTTTTRNGVTKSASSDRAIKNPKVYNRSTSADSRDQITRQIQASPSSQSLKGDGRSQQNGAVKKSSIPSPTLRSNSNASMNTPGSPSATKKQVTSKIASLWKKIEDSKKQVPKPDSRVWIQPEVEREPPRLIRSNTFENKDGTTLIARCDNEEKRISRLESFVITDGGGDGVTTDSF